MSDSFILQGKKRAIKMTNNKELDKRFQDNLGEFSSLTSNVLMPLANFRETKLT